jgi:uncharacterized membrane protein YoaK (UPF0700 family)
MVAVSEPTTPPSRALALAVVLAASAGFVDAHVYLFVVQVFVANQSGNLIGLGMTTGQEQWHDAASSVAAIASFIIGVVAATTFQRRDRAAGRPSRMYPLLQIEAAALLGLALLLWIADPRLSDGWRVLDLVVIFVGAVAMGVQSASLRTVGTVSITTTYGTGALVRVGEKLAAPFRADGQPGDPQRMRTLAVLAIVLSAYVGGAAISAALGSAHGLVLIPALAMVGAAVVARRAAIT